MEKNISIFSQVQTFGFILFTENFSACEKFYEEILELLVLYRKHELTAFSFGNGYLLVEGEGHASSVEKNRKQNPFVMRFNTDDIDSVIEKLKLKGVQASKQVFEWGTIAAFTDPDGNLCEFKSPA